MHVLRRVDEFQDLWVDDEPMRKIIWEHWKRHLLMNRCEEASCRKKVGLLGFACKCAKTYCATHRHPEDHLCAAMPTFKDKTALHQPKIVAPKVNSV